MTLTCSICQNDIHNEIALTLECNHIFHLTCINTWLRIKDTCPLCRSTSEHKTNTDCQCDTSPLNRDERDILYSLACMYSSTLLITTILRADMCSIIEELQTIVSYSLYYNNSIIFVYAESLLLELGITPLGHLLRLTEG